MNKNNKNTEIENTDKKLHISDVMFSFWFTIIMVVYSVLIFLMIDNYQKPLSLILITYAIFGIISINQLEKGEKIKHN